MQRIRYGFKAAALDPAQLRDRFEISGRLSLDDFFCELYLDGADIKRRQVREKITANASMHKGSYALHIPLVDRDDKFYNPSRIKTDYIGYLADISGRLGNAAIILHRFWDYNTDISWEDADKRYKDWLWRIAGLYQPFQFLVENFGFVFRNENGRVQPLISPLDHFFPQEIDDFNKWLKAAGIKNVRPFIDTAHANLTLNLLRAAGIDPERAWKFIHPSLREKVESGVFRLDSIEDYFCAGVFPYFHISDSRSLPEGAKEPSWPDYFSSEGLPPGDGDIKWERFFTKLLEAYDGPTFIIEAAMKDPKNGVEQEKGVRFVQNVIERICKTANKV